MEDQPKKKFKDDDRLHNRPASKIATDIKALHAIVQAAVDVELFTIPLYMTSLYSLQGMHEINSKGSDFYEGRIWPGMAPVAHPKTGNDKAFNAVFSVFVAEMLHLQIVSNLANVVGYSATFTEGALQDKNCGWTCYGENQKKLPHIIDLNDAIAPYNQINVKLGALNEEQLQLFLAIEQTDKMANSIIDPAKEHLYTQEAPYNDWEEGRVLPLFGSIGNMYLQLWRYLILEYNIKEGDELSDDLKKLIAGKKVIKLWEIVFEMGRNLGKQQAEADGNPNCVPAAVQKEIFNPARLNSSLNEKDKEGNPINVTDEYPHMATSIETPEVKKALLDVLNMINGITDQGEGGGVVDEIKARSEVESLTAVMDDFRPSCPVLKRKYPSYSADGKQVDSAKAEARHHYGAMDHYETFAYVLDLVKDNEVLTWDKWHEQNNQWTPKLLQTAAYDPARYPKLPASEDIAGALNRLKQNDADGKNFVLFSRTAAGSIAGVTKELDKYFKNTKAPFPYPSMSGSGDRLSICWAVFGKAPDLSLGISEKGQEPNRYKHIYHACQGLNLDKNPQVVSEDCAQVAIFHSCKSSNSCKGEGGCGFVQSTSGGSGCGGTKVAPVIKDSKDVTYSPPSDNACGSLGGCAVPISASQMYPEQREDDVYRMQLHNFGEEPPFEVSNLQTMYYDKGDLVYDVAWNAFRKVLEARGEKAPPKPKPSDLRLAFPPST